MSRPAALLLLAGCGLLLQAAEERVLQSYLRLQKEDIRNVKVWLQKKSQSLSQFVVADKRPVNNNYSVMVVTGSDSHLPPSESWLGVFVVYGETNQTYMVLDVSPAPRYCHPHLESPREETIYIQWFGGYGYYCGIYKYTYNLGKRQSTHHYSYRRFSVETAGASDNEVFFAGGYATPTDLAGHTAEVSIVLARAAAEPRWTVRDAAPAMEAAPSKKKQKPRVPNAVMMALPPMADGSQPSPERIIRVKDDLWLYAAGGLPGWPKPKSGVYLVNSQSQARFYPVPAPAAELYVRLRLKTEADMQRPDVPGNLENDIGPFAFDGERLWFANKFYDGEGFSGVGVIGSFDITSLTYEMRYLPETAQWSGSALLLDEDSIWVGLVTQGEGAPYGGGLLQFNKQTGSVRTYPIKNCVSTLTIAGSVLYAGTDDGVYELNTGTQQLSHVAVEPGPGGPQQIVTRPVPLN